MKKIIVLLVICLISFNLCGCTINHKNQTPIIENSVKQNIEAYINSQTPRVKKEIDDAYLDAKDIHKNFLKEPNPKEVKWDYLDKLDTYDIYIGSPELHLYWDIIKKFMNVTDDNIPATDNPETLYDFIYPFLIKNGVDLTKIQEISEYGADKQQAVEKLYEEIRVYGEKPGF